MINFKIFTFLIIVTILGSCSSSNQNSSTSKLDSRWVKFASDNRRPLYNFTTNYYYDKLTLKNENSVINVWVKYVNVSEGEPDTGGSEYWEIYCSSRTWKNLSGFGAKEQNIVPDSEHEKLFIILCK